MVCWLHTNAYYVWNARGESRARGSRRLFCLLCLKRVVCRRHTTTWSVL
jgi:hypothetical protein